MFHYIPGQGLYKKEGGRSIQLTEDKPKPKHPLMRFLMDLSMNPHLLRLYFPGPQQGPYPLPANFFEYAKDLLDPTRLFALAKLKEELKTEGKELEPYKPLGQK